MRILVIVGNPELLSRFKLVFSTSAWSSIFSFQVPFDLVSTQVDLSIELTDRRPLRMAPLEGGYG